MADNPFVVVQAPNYAVPLIDFSGLSGQNKTQQQSTSQSNSAQTLGQALAAFAKSKTSQQTNTDTPAGNPSETEAYIRQAAKSRGIDPNIAVRVAKSEGLNSYTGDAGSSFGPYQLHYGGVAPGGNSVGGLGDAFTQQTGLNARDPATVQKQIDFSLDYASKHGWGPWHGWKGDPYAGITRGNVDVGLY